MKIRDIIRLIEAEGWYLIETKGSHRQYKIQNSGPSYNCWASQ